MGDPKDPAKDSFSVTQNCIHILTRSEGWDKPIGGAVSYEKNCAWINDLIEKEMTSFHGKLCNVKWQG